ncbi:M48 family metallopeptidase [Pseudomonadota bacterium]
MAMEINYKVIYSKKRKRSILVKIEDDGTPIVYAPYRAKEAEIERFINSKRSWILKKSMLVKKCNENRFCFVSEKKILYMGKEYEFIVNESKLLKKDGFCEFCEGKLIVNIPESVFRINEGLSRKSREDVYKSCILQTIRNWYVDEANEKLIKKSKYYAGLHDFPVNNICAKEQKSIWGCCDSRNNIRYNWRIIMTDENLINYLVVHELSHTVHKNHSKDFWRLVESIIPNHKDLRKQLRNMNYILRMEFR